MVCLKLLLLFASSVFRSVLGQDQDQPESSSVDSSVGTKCCNALRAKLPSKVFARGTPEYNARHTTYYSLQQQELMPLCTVKPQTAQDVSDIVKLAKANQCPFAVASGGHMSWKGSSNLDGGFVIDMRGMNQIDISTKDQTVKLGPGSPWTNVYDAMSNYNVSTTGARINAVGVGGFLLGGGIAFASVDKGFGADNVFNYEVVLSDGRIVSVNNDTNSDLFWALKLAGSNYGIVTRFDMHTYSSPLIWGAVSLYPYSNQSASELFNSYEEYGHDDKNKKDFLSVVFAHQNGTDLAMSVQVNLDAVARAPLTSVEPIMSSEKVGNTHDVVDEVIAHALDSTARTSWYTITTKIGSEFFKDIYEQGDQVFKSLKDREGFSLTVGFQSFQKSFIEGAARTPVYNALKRSNADLVCILIFATWTSPADDADMKQATNTLGSWAEAEARKLGLLDDFIYLNYANEQQRVYERSVTPDDLDRMREIQKTYDASGTYEKLWRGGYKLPKKDYHGSETGAGVGERDDL
ncbi:FAD-binding domain-containing protein [Marasmius fiardii PR-910]|nr:FAD-binding domain-containing protein [Marasmius fiardii PR-910]